MSGRGTLALVVVAAVVAACGGSSGGSAAPSEAVASEAVPSEAAPSDAPASIDAGSSQPAASQGSGVFVPPVFGWTFFANGSGKIEIHGDVTATIEGPGTGITAAEQTVISFAATNGDAFAIGFGTDGNGISISLTSQGIFGGGDFDEGNCTIDFSKNDATGVEGTFHCTDLLAASPGSVDLKSIDVDGEFSLSS